MESLIGNVLIVGRMFGCSPLKIDARGQVAMVRLAFPYTLLLLAGYIALVVLDDRHRHEELSMTSFVNMLGVIAGTLQMSSNLVFNWIQIAEVKRTVSSLIHLDAKVREATSVGMGALKLKAITTCILASIVFAVAFATGFECLDLLHVEITAKLRFFFLYFGLAVAGIVVFQIAAFALILYETYGRLHQFLLSVFSGATKAKRNCHGYYLEDFRLILMSLNATSASLNRCFSKQLLVLFLNGFISITLHSYHALKDTRTYVEYYIATGSYVFVHLYYMLLVATVFHLIGDKVASIGTKLLAFPKDAFGFLTNEAFEISGQLRNYPVSFTALHFFKINISTILNILGTASTYLIILIQSNPSPSQTYNQTNNQITFAAAPQPASAKAVPVLQLVNATGRGTFSLLF